MPPKNKPMKPQDNSMKGKLLRAGDALRANVAKAKPMVEKIGDKVQTMTGRKPDATKGVKAAGPAKKAKPRGIISAGPAKRK